jgi:hypothetical protein
MALNPYASFLGERDPLVVIRSTPAAVRDQADRIGPDRIRIAPAPGKWSARDILAHLADCEIVFAFRLRQALAEDDHRIQPFDQNLWARTYDIADPAAALAAFAAVRAWNVALVEGVPATAFERRLTHPERGTMTFQTVVETIGGHDINHLRQLEAIQP